MKNHRKAIDELERGIQFANQLRQVINGDDDKSATSTAIPLAQNLLKNVIKSFANTLFLFDKYPTYQSREDSQMPQRDYSSLVCPLNSEDFQETYRSSTRRGCYKRSKTTQTWEKVSEIQTDDGYQWRKYGQKAILNSKYSRNYYRCTHRIDQRCQATKQVQQIQEEPPLYKTIYFGHHTCKSLLHHEILHDINSVPHNSTLISFDKTFPTPTKQDCPLLSSYLPSPSLKKECKEDIPSLSILDNSSRHVTLTSTLELDHRGVMSGLMYDSIELDDFYQPWMDFDDQLGMFWSLD